MMILKRDVHRMFHPTLESSHSIHLCNMLFGEQDDYIP